MLALASGVVFFQFLTLLCGSIGLRQLFFVKYAFFYLDNAFFCTFLINKCIFKQHICIFYNFGPRKTLDLVESFRLTPVPSGSDETTIYFWGIQSEPKRCASHGPPSARESRAMCRARAHRRNHEFLWLIKADIMTSPKSKAWRTFL